jgi:hypothetical protein
MAIFGKEVWSFLKNFLSRQFLGYLVAAFLMYKGITLTWIFFLFFVIYVFGNKLDKVIELLKELGKLGISFKDITNLGGK